MATEAPAPGAGSARLAEDPQGVQARVATALRVPAVPREVLSAGEQVLEALTAQAVAWPASGETGGHQA